MYAINLPTFELKIRQQDGKDYVLDSLRRQYIRLTPEEFVRQHFIHYLTAHKNYPSALLSNEKEISLGNVKKRCDTIVYDRQLNALAIIEYKAPFVEITQEVFEQIARYNMTLQVPWLIVSNGLQHFCCYIGYVANNFRFVKEIPDYTELASSF
jgi:hypothetical protein